MTVRSISHINHRSAADWIASALMWVNNGRRYGADMQSSREACFATATQCIEYALILTGEA